MMLPLKRTGAITVALTALGLQVGRQSAADL